MVAVLTLTVLVLDTRRRDRLAVPALMADLPAS
jgi:hypothetical protein